MNQMAFRIVSCLLLLLQASVADAQNLVVNGDFEAYNNCPANVSTIDYSPTFSSFPCVQNWVRPTVNGSSDYFNACSPPIGVSVPLNSFGYQSAHSGNGYAGMFGVLEVGSGQPVYRELISTRLPAGLKKDSLYCVRFYASTTVINSNRTKIAANSVGAFISDTLPTTIPPPSADPSRFILNDTNRHLTDTTLWYEIAGVYQARGGERWITIGVFFDGARPPHSLISSGTISQFENYMYVDDVSVHPTQARSSSQTIQYCGEPLRLTAPQQAGSGFWSTGESGRFITVSAPGAYVYSSRSDCTAMTDSFIVLPVPVSDTVVESRISLCTSSGINQRLASPITGSLYKWSSGETSREITVTALGTYTCVVVRDCRAYPVRFEVTNAMPEPPVLNDTMICLNADAPLLQTGYGDLVWFTAKGAGPYTTQPVIKTTEKAEILLYASRKNGDCLTPRVPVRITIGLPPRQGTAVEVLRCNGQPTDLKIGGSRPPGDTYSWSSGETDFEIRVPAADGMYTRTNSNMCGMSTDTFTVSSSPCDTCVLFPNAFTPNGDGTNDGFRGLVRCHISDFLLRIYNRWGQMVFVTGKPEIAWDGTFKGLPAGIGTYMYQCIYRSTITGQQFRSQGDLLLVR